MGGQEPESNNNKGKSVPKSTLPRRRPGGQLPIRDPAESRRPEARPGSENSQIEVSRAYREQQGIGHHYRRQHHHHHHHGGYYNNYGSQHAVRLPLGNVRSAAVFLPQNHTSHAAARGQEVSKSEAGPAYQALMKNEGDTSNSDQHRSHQTASSSSGSNKAQHEVGSKGRPGLVKRLTSLLRDKKSGLSVSLPNRNDRLKYLNNKRENEKEEENTILPQHSQLTSVLPPAMDRAHDALTKLWDEVEQANGKCSLCERLMIGSVVMVLLDSLHVAVMRGYANADQIKKEEWAENVAQLMTLLDTVAHRVDRTK